MSAAVQIESWRAVAAFPAYEVSDFGNVRRSGKPIAGFADRDGYLRVNLVDRDRRKQRSVHSLVAEAFIGPAPAGNLVRHKDGNPRNAALDNLEYGTSSDNEADKRRHGRAMVGHRNHRSKLHPSEVANIKILKSCGSHATDIAQWFGVTFKTVYSICRGDSWGSL